MSEKPLTKGTELSAWWTRNRLGYAVFLPSFFAVALVGEGLGLSWWWRFPLAFVIGCGVSISMVNWLQPLPPLTYYSGHPGCSWVLTGQSYGAALRAYRRHEAVAHAGQHRPWHCSRGELR